jgi:hypothetical protein
MAKHEGRGLDDTYGVVVGGLLGTRQDPPSGRGRYNHFHIVVDTLQGLFSCAVNLGASRDQNVQYFFKLGITLEQLPQLRTIVRSRSGFYALTPDAGSGALDVIRHPDLTQDTLQTQLPESWKDAWAGPARERVSPLLDTVRPLLDRTTRLSVFGALVEANAGGRFELHEVHVNQGDPDVIAQSVQNGPWQDGGVILEYDDSEAVPGHDGLRDRFTRRYAVLVTKFKSQSLDPGHV